MKIYLTLILAIFSLLQSLYAKADDCLDLQDNKIQTVSGRGDARQSLGVFTVQINKPLCNRQCDVGDLIRLDGKYKSQLEWRIMRKSDYYKYVGKDIVVTGWFSCSKGAISETSIKLSGY